MIADTAYDLITEMIALFLYKGCIGKPERIICNKDFVNRLRKENKLSKDKVNILWTDIEETDEAIISMSKGDFTMTWGIQMSMNYVMEEI